MKEKNNMEKEMTKDRGRGDQLRPWVEAKLSAANA